MTERYSVIKRGKSFEQSWFFSSFLKSMNCALIWCFSSVVCFGHCHLDLFLIWFVKFGGSVWIGWIKRTWQKAGGKGGGSWKGTEAGRRVSLANPWSVARRRSVATEWSLCQIIFSAAWPWVQMFHSRSFSKFYYYYYFFFPLPSRVQTLSISSPQSSPLLAASPTGTPFMC